MDSQNIRAVLQEVERVTEQAEQLRPYWDHLLEQAHAVSEQIQARIQKATDEADSSGQPLDNGGPHPQPVPESRQ
jgi:hypothetical protein